MPLPRFTLHNAALLVVDVQEKLVPLIDGGPTVEQQCVKLIRGCATLGVPILTTEQYPRGLGPTVRGVHDALPAGTPVEQKMKFSACIEGVRQHLRDQGRTAVLLCGLETHVCVMQTALDLMDWGYIVGVAVDAVGSRTSRDHEVGLQRMLGAGTVPVSVEMALLELVHEAGTDRFKSILPIIKGG